MKEKATPYSKINYPRTDLKLNRLQNMFLTKSMLVGNLRGVHDSCLIPNIPDSWKRRFNFTFYGSLLKNKLHFLEDKDYYFVSHVWGSGYYHWLTEIAPKLFLFEKQIKSGTLLFPFSTPNFIREFLEAWEFNNVEFYKDNCFIRKLHVIDNPNSGHYDEDLLFEFRKKTFQKVGNPKQNIPQKIYVSRKNSRARKVVNEQDVIDKLKQEDFTCIELDDLSFFEQVNIFGNCNYFVSIHGAALTNSIFMPIGSKIVELFPDHPSEMNLSACYYRLAQVLGHEHQFVWCQRENPQEEFKLDTDNIIVDVKKLLLN